MLSAAILLLQWEIDKPWALAPLSWDRILRWIVV